MKAPLSLGKPSKLICSKTLKDVQRCEGGQQIYCTFPKESWWGGGCVRYAALIIMKTWEYFTKKGGGH